ncbi:MAG TPA: chorismate-binding protein [Candidatus Rubrimentiphilum sp.]|nr:chorismate-binding protein [Candidatus Rubrimentiphilum sp.]
MLRARTPQEAWNALARADSALAAGYYVAGFLSYELGAACVGLPRRNATAPLLALGIYDNARPIVLAASADDFAMGPPLPRVSRAKYGETIDAITSAIRDGEVYQINYTLPFDFAFSGEPFDVYCRLASRSGAQYCAYVEDEERAIVSFSPELFLRFEDGRLVTKPMKGTAPLDAIDELTNEKNRAEHLMIVDLLRNDLHRICTGVTVDELFTIERYPTFGTMTSTISGALPAGAPLAEIVRATFPCGSVTGAPKRAAMAHIARFEPDTREIYTGSIGYLAPQRTGWWNVAIRTMQIDRASGSGRLDAGGGIVSDSEAADEWSEVLLKTAFVRPAIEPFACLETLRCGPDPSPADAHLSRLRATAERFAIPFDDTVLREQIDALNAHPALTLVRIRLAPDGNATLASEPFESAGESARICIAEARVRSNDAMLGFKTSWRPAHDAAAETAQRLGCFDALLRNERDELTEGSRTNLFVCIGGVLYTPPLHSGVLPGILRGELVSSGRAVERVLHERDLRDADEIFVGNSARGLLEAHLVSEPNRV